MKRIFSLILTVAMVMSLCISAFASQTSTVTYVGAGRESYSVTVPGSIEPGKSGTISVTGTWASNRELTVSAPTSVTLVNGLKNTETKELAITFAGISLRGSNTSAINQSYTISIAEAEGILFGTWTGTITYTISMGDAP